MPGTEGCETELGANIDLSHTLSADKISVTLQINASSISPVAPGLVSALAPAHLPTLCTQQAEPSSGLLGPWPQLELLQQPVPAPTSLTRCSQEEGAQALGAEQLVPWSGHRQARQAGLPSTPSQGWLLGIVQDPHPEQTPEAPLLDFRVFSLRFPWCSLSGSSVVCELVISGFLQLTSFLLTPYTSLGVAINYQLPGYTYAGMHSCTQGLISNPSLSFPTHTPCTISPGTGVHYLQVSPNPEPHPRWGLDLIHNHTLPPPPPSLIPMLGLIPFHHLVSMTETEGPLVTSL